MPVIEHENFKILNQLGVGSFGKVYKAIYTPTNLEVALKIIDLESTNDDIEDIQEEVRVISECRNPHITKYYGSFVYKYELWICMELLSGGSCLDLIRMHRPSLLPESVVAEIIAQFLIGLQYLHRSGKIHRDIKAANILIARNAEIKIADFGVAAQISTFISKRNSFVGTPFWMAPEVILANDCGYTFSADIWSLGITCIELATAKPPYSDVHPMKAIILIPERPAARLPSNFSAEFQDFVSQCLQKDPAKRADVDKLLTHPFLNSRSLSDLKEYVQKVTETLDKKLQQEPFQPPSQEPEPEFEDVDWDFGTIKPESITQILDTSTLVNNSTLENRSVENTSLENSTLVHRDIPNETLKNESMRSTLKNTLRSSQSTQSMHGASKLCKIFNHASRKFQNPNLADISMILKSASLSKEEDDYLVRKIGKQAVQQFDLKPSQNLDNVEQILVNKYLSELSNAH